MSAAGTGTSPHSPRALAVAGSPGTPAPSPEGGTCPAPGAPRSGCALAPAVETPLRGQSFCPGPRPAQPSPRRPHSPLARAGLQRVLPAGTLVTSLGDFSSVMSQAPEPHGDTCPSGHGHCPRLCSPCSGKSTTPLAGQSSQGLSTCPAEPRGCAPGSPHGPAPPPAAAAAAARSLWGEVISHAVTRVRVAHAPTPLLL